MSSDNNNLLEIARSALLVHYFGVYAFKFYHPETGEKMAVANSLTTLLIHLGTIPDEVFYYYLQEQTKFDAEIALRGDGSWLDIALWINYVLGDEWLSNRVTEIIKTPQSIKLRRKIIRTCQERHEVLRRILIRQKLI